MITNWIVNLDDSYEQYEKSDLDRFGTLIFDDKVAILQYVKRLSSQKSQHKQAAPEAYQPHQYQNDGRLKCIYIVIARSDIVLLEFCFTSFKSVV